MASLLKWMSNFVLATHLKITEAAGKINKFHVSKTLSFLYVGHADILKCGL